MKHPIEIEFHGMTIPDYMAEGLLRYVEDGIPPTASFRSATLTRTTSRSSRPTCSGSTTRHRLAAGDHPLGSTLGL